jgi:AraC-like DNA-binding protein
MPVLKCTDPQCGHEWFERSELAVGENCVECGAPAVRVDTYHERSDEPPETREQAGAGRGRAGGPRLSYVRQRARNLLREHHLHKPPIPVRAIARRAGMSITDSHALGELRARLIEDRIELAADDPEVIKRFSIAHELGHHVLDTTHGSGPNVELEANAFAGELLVPGPQLHVAMRETTDLSQLSQRFQVSSTVVRIAAETHRKAHLLS